MASNFCVAAGAIYPYAKAKQIDWPTVRKVAPWAMATVALGVWMSAGIDAVLYRGLFGTFILIMVAHEVRVLLRPPATAPTVRPLSQAPAAATGAAAGLVSGVLSVGGGVIFVPILREWLRMPVKRAVGTSMAMVLPTVAVGATAQMWAMSQTSAPPGGSMLPGALVMAGCLAPSALAGGWIGAKLNARLPRTPVTWVMTSALGISAVLLMRPWLASLFFEQTP